MAQFQLAQEEFIRGSLTTAFRPRTIVLFLIAMLLIGSSLFFRGNALWESIFLSFVPMAVIIVTVYFATRWRLKRVFHEQQSLREVIDVSIDDQRLSYSWARGTYILPWANVQRGKETRNFFILWESSAFARMLPKRVLSAEETATIRKNIASK
jgi:hypothetical protein